MKLIDVQKKPLEYFKRLLKQDIEKNGFQLFKQIRIIVNNRDFCYVVQKYEYDILGTAYVLTIQENQETFGMWWYNGVLPSLDEIWEKIENKYRHPEVNYYKTEYNSTR